MNLLNVVKEKVKALREQQQMTEERLENIL